MSRAHSSAPSRFSKPSSQSSGSRPGRPPQTASSRCARSNARVGAVGARSSPSTIATASRCNPRTSAPSSRSSAVALSKQAKTHLLFGKAEGRDLTRLAEYEQVGGYESLKKSLKMERAAVLDQLLAANVRGRGGAVFPPPAAPAGGGGWGRPLFPYGPQGELPPEARREREADLPRGECRRIR